MGARGDRRSSSLRRSSGRRSCKYRRTSSSTSCGSRTLPPSLAHPFGTDPFSRDVLARVLCGARISLAIATLAVALSMTLGTAYGLVAGYVGGRIDAVMMRLLDAFLSIPRVLLLIAVLSLWNPVPLSGLIVLIGATGWFAVSRLVRAEALSARRHRLHRGRARARRVRRAHPAGGTCCRTSSAPVIVTATLAVGNVIALEAGLSYLGIGARPPTASWGSHFHRRRRRVHRPGVVGRRSFPGSRSSSPCWRSMCSATPCATSSIRGSFTLDRPLAPDVDRIRWPPRLDHRRMADPLLRVREPSHVLLHRERRRPGRRRRQLRDRRRRDGRPRRRVGLRQVGHRALASAPRSPPGRIEPGSEIHFDGKNLVTLDERVDARRSAARASRWCFRNR